MKIVIKTASVVFGVLLLSVSLADGQSLDGNIGSAAGQGWQSSWINLRHVTNFQSGEKLRFTLGGRAKKVIVRLLPQGINPNLSAGIEGGVREIPPGGVLEVTLARNHPNVVQVSVHGGQAAWDTRLGSENGEVKLINVERISAVPSESLASSESEVASQEQAPVKKLQTPSRACTEVIKLVKKLSPDKSLIFVQLIDQDLWLGPPARKCDAKRPSGIGVAQVRCYECIAPDGGTSFLYFDSTTYEGYGCPCQEK